MDDKVTIGMVLALTPEDHSLPTQPAYRFEFLKQHYYEALEEYDAVTIAIPGTLRHDLIDHYCSLVDGLLIMGGEDIHPELYGEEIDSRCNPRMPRRDSFEAGLIRRAHEHRIPIFGICRGMQMVNVAFGGSLYQDLEDHPGADPAQVNHSQVGELDFSTSHAVKIVEGSRLHLLVGRTEIETNTCHHQAVKRVGAGLTISATANDGIAEGIEVTDVDAFTVAVQWHPEVWPHDSPSKAIIGGFCKAARDYKGKQ